MKWMLIFKLSILLTFYLILQINADQATTEAPTKMEPSELASTTPASTNKSKNPSGMSNDLANTPKPSTTTTENREPTRASTSKELLKTTPNTLNDEQSSTSKTEEPPKEQSTTTVGSSENGKETTPDPLTPVHFTYITSDEQQNIIEQLPLALQNMIPTTNYMIERLEITDRPPDAGAYAYEGENNREDDSMYEYLSEILDYMMLPFTEVESLIGLSESSEDKSSSAIGGNGSEGTNNSDDNTILGYIMNLFGLSSISNYITSPFTSAESLIKNLIS